MLHTIQIDFKTHADINGVWIDVKYLLHSIDIEIGMYFYQIPPAKIGIR